MKNIGTKIVVVGVSASGKTTFAKKLSVKVGLPVFIMDEFMWKPGWNYIGDEETRKKLEEISFGEKWIIEGYITKGLRKFIFDKADTIVYLDYSRFVASWRYLRRWFAHRKNPRPELPGSPEKFSFKFLKLVWTKGEAISLNRFLAEVENKEKIVTLKSPREARGFLKDFK